MKKRADLLLFLIAIGLLFALILHSNPQVIAKTLSRANLVFVAPALAITILIIGVKIVRWRVILESVGINLSLKQITQPYMASLLVSNITPGRVGEPVRSYYLKRSLGHSISRTLPTVLLERILDISTLLIFYISGIFVLYTTISKTFVVAAAIVALGVTVVILFASSKKMLRFVFDRLYQIFKFVPKINKLGKKVEKLPETFHTGFMLASKSRRVPALVMMTLMAWIMEFSIIKFSFLSIGVDIGFVTIASVASIATIVGLMTFLPGNIGSFEATAAVLFTQIVPGVDLATATSGVIIYRLSSLWFALLFCSKSFLKYQYQ